jgi:hypothetical protein
MRSSASRVLIFVLGISVGSTPGDAQTLAEPCPDPTAVMSVERPFRPIVHELWRRAPTFRRQVLRIRQESSLTVAIGLWRFTSPADLRARTVFAHVEGRLTRADIEIKLFGGLATVEFIAHEVEHVLEQLDGIDLARMTGRGGVTIMSGTSPRAHIETKRAQQVGRIVAAEYETYDLSHAALDQCLRMQR